MSEANINVKFGNPDPYINIPSYVSITAELCKAKVNILLHQIASHYDKYSKILKKYRLPVVVMEVPKKFEKLEYKMIDHMMEGESVKERLITNDRCYCMYEPKTPEQVVLLKKL